MFSPETHQQVLQEQRKDKLADMENKRLLQGAGSQPVTHTKSNRKIINWLGAHMISWGAKLQSYGTTPISTQPVSKTS